MNVGPDTTVTMPLGTLVVLISFIVGLVISQVESRFKLAQVGDKTKEHGVQMKALETQQQVYESRSARTDSRVDHMYELMMEVRSDVKRLLERRDAA